MHHLEQDSERLRTQSEKVSKPVFEIYFWTILCEPIKILSEKYMFSLTVFDFAENREN